MNDLTMQRPSRDADADATLATAVTQCRALLASHASPAWKLLPSPTTSFNGNGNANGNGNGNGQDKDKAKASGIGAVEAVQVHKRRGAMTVRGGNSNVDVLRATAEIPVSDGVDLHNFRAVLQTPEVRSVCKFVTSTLMLTVMLTVMFTTTTMIKGTSWWRKLLQSNC